MSNPRKSAGGLARWIFTVVSSLAAVASCEVALAEVTVKPAAKGYDIDVTEEASASDVVDAIVEATGVDIKGEPDDTSVPVNHLRNVSLERALRILLPHVPFAVRFDADDTPQTIIFMATAKGDGSQDGVGDGQNSDTSGAGSNSSPDDPYSPTQEPPDTSDPPEMDSPDDPPTDGN